MTTPGTLGLTGRGCPWNASRPVQPPSSQRSPFPGAIFLCAVLANPACDTHSEPPAEPAPPPVAAAPVEVDAAPAPAPEPEPEPPRLFARKFVSRLRAGPSNDEPTIGYMRAGTVVTAKNAKPLGHDRCRRGWYEVVETGGFVCDGREVTAFVGKKLPDRRPAVADRDARLPYVYAYNRRAGTPLYKRLPNEEEALRWEDGILPPEEQPPDAGPPKDAAPMDVSPGAADAGPPRKKTLAELLGERGAFVRRLLEPGFYLSMDRTFEVGRRRYWRSMSNGYIPYDRMREVEGSAFRGVLLAPGPYPEVAPPVDSEGAVNAQPMASTPSLPIVAAKTTAPTVSGPEKARAGVVEPAADPVADPPSGDKARLHLPVGFVMSNKTARFQRNERGWIKRADKPGYHHMFQVVAREKVRSRDYVRDRDGFLYRVDQVRLVEPSEPLPGLTEGERWIDVDLASQTLVAYEGTVPVFATLISSGRVRRVHNPLLNHETPTGVFHILSKHVSTTMQGDHAIDGPYSLEDVPYVQFFKGAFALHSAFWHNRFGRPSSHGCINLPPEDARWLFNWTGPEVPRLWHAAYPRDRKQGTRVRIRGTTPRG